MGNDLVKFSAGGLPANPEDLVKGLQNVASAVQTAGGVPFLRLLKSSPLMHWSCTESCCDHSSP